MPPLIARPRDPPPPLSDNGEGPLRRRSLAASAALHVGIVVALLLLLRSTPLTDEPVVKVTVLQDGPGAAGAAGGAGGGGGEAREANSASAQEQPDDTPQAAQTTNESPAKTEAKATPSPAPPQQEAPPPESPTTTAMTLEPPPPPPRQKPRPSHPHPSPPTSPAPRAADTPSDEPVQIASAPAAVPTPGTPGAGGGQGGAGGLGTGADGAGHGAVGDGPLEGPGDDYLDRLKRWLNKYKHYPKDALDKKQEGRLVVSFIILRDGTVLDPRIERSSGVPSLDAAAIEMLHAASPVPPLPETYRGERATLDLPVGYSIGLVDKLF